MTAWLRCKFSHGDVSQGERVFGGVNESVLKVGTLGSSQIYIKGDGVNRMHAVLENSGNEWELIDLGANAGSYLDGQRVDKNVILPRHGTMGFGDWVIRFEVVEAEERPRLSDGAVEFDGSAPKSSAAPRPAPSSARSSAAAGFASRFFEDDELPPEFSGDRAKPSTTLGDVLGGNALGELLSGLAVRGPAHHEKLAKTLLDELKELAPQNPTVSKLGPLIEMWGTFGDVEKREILGKLISAVRALRETRAQAVAELESIPTEELREIVTTGPEEACREAKKHLREMVLTKASLELLDKLTKDETLEKTQAEELADGDTEGAEETAALRAGRERLEKDLAIDVVKSGLRTLLYLGRVAGHPLTEDRIQVLIGRLRGGSAASSE